MASPSYGRSSRRQMFMERLFAALPPVVGPRLSFEAHGGKGVVVLLDGGAGGSMITRAAPWLPGVTVARDLAQTARGVADAVACAAAEFPPGTTSLGDRSPTVTTARGMIRIQFFGLGGEPLPVVEVQLEENDR